MSSAGGSSAGGKRQMHVLVVDDEPLAVRELRRMLEAEPSAGKVRTAANAAQAKHVMDTEMVDVVLLDIHMPGQTGLELARDVARQGRGGPRPQIVFVTADAQPAVEAFEIEARDYLLKPVRQSRLAEALRRAAEAAEPAPGTELEQVRVSVLQGDATVLVEIASIRWVQAQGDYARLHTDGGSYLLRVALTDLEDQWAEHGFVRIHRSHLVNLHHAQRVTHRQGRMSVQLRATVGREEELAVSRRLIPNVRERLDSHRVRGGGAAITMRPRTGGAPGPGDGTNPGDGLSPGDGPRAAGR